MSEFESEAEKICSYRVLLRLTHLYGPAVRCKPKVNGGGWSCASVSGPCMERLCSWPSWISARTRSHSRKGPERPLGSPDHGYDGETVSPSPQFNSQTSAGIAVTFLGCAGDQPWTSPSAGPNALILCDLWLDARFVAATLCQHSPSDPRQLIGECSCQDVMV